MHHFSKNQISRERRNQIAARGFTLVELLIVMSILTVLGSLALLVIRGAVENAKKARTESQIAKVNEILNQRWDEYEVRILPIRISSTAAESNGWGRVFLAKLRSDSMLQLIRAEMPNRMTYITSNQFPTAGYDGQYPALVGPPHQFRRPSLYERYTSVASVSWTDEHQEAECLYMILQSIVVLDQSGVDFLFEDEVRDTDNDGMLEVLDGFGKPLQFKIFYDTDANEETVNFVEVDDFETFFDPAQTYELTRLRFLVRSENFGDEDPL